MLRSKAGTVALSLGVMVTLAQAGPITHGSTTIDMPFVDIGYAGNTNSSAGYGAVGYNYQIGKYEVTADQWAAVIAADSNVGNSGSWSGLQPTASANWYEAAKFCNWLTTGDAFTGVYQFTSGVFSGYDRSYRNGNDMAYMLPSENEWYKAAFYKNDGSGYTLYATGDSTPGLDTDANYSGGVYGDPWNVGTGAEENNETFDMGGNVWEWTDGAANALVTNAISFWGGAYNSALSKLDSASGPYGDDPDLSHPAIGFRVVAIPEPGTISLMSISTLGLFATRRMRRRKLLGRSLIPVRSEHWCDSFCSLDEWEAARNAELEGPDSFAICGQYIKACVLNVYSTLRTPYKELEKRFWNHMVVAHERRVARRKAIRRTIRNKVIDSFDAFLALLMK